MMSMRLDLDSRKNAGKRVHRRRLEIVKDMLVVVLQKSKKTRIMYQANLSYHLLEKYLESILESGLVQCDEDSCYVITRKGKEFLQMYEGYLERRSRIHEAIENVHSDRSLLEDMCFNNESNMNKVLNKKEVLVDTEAT